MKRECFLQDVVYCYNITPHTTTKYSPFFAFRGRHPDALRTEDNSVALSPEMLLQKQQALTNAIQQKIKENTEKAAHKSEKYKNRNVKVYDFKKGEKVMILQFLDF